MHSDTDTQSEFTSNQIDTHSVQLQGDNSMSLNKGFGGFR